MENRKVVEIANSGDLNGKVVLERPKAGKRNEALIKAKKESVGGEAEVLFIVRLLPECIVEHPWGKSLLTDALNALETQDYDLLSKTLTQMMNPGDGDVAKK